MEALVVVNAVRRKVLSIKCNFYRGNCNSYHLRVIDSLLNNVQRISQDDPEKYSELLDSLRTLRTVRTVMTSRHQQAPSTTAPLIRTGWLLIYSRVHKACLVLENMSVVIIEAYIYIYIYMYINKDTKLKVQVAVTVFTNMNVCVDLSKHTRSNLSVHRFYK